MLSLYKLLERSYGCLLGLFGGMAAIIDRDWVMGGLMGGQMVIEASSDFMNLNILMHAPPYFRHRIWIDLAESCKNMVFSTPWPNLGHLWSPYYQTKPKKHPYDLSRCVIELV